MKKDLLLEIGTEEIPASFLAPASEALKEILTKFSLENRITFGEIKSFYTPRRIALIIDKVAEKQKEEILELQGPPKKHAFDDKGHPTKVAIGFANSNKVKVKDLYTKQTPKGEYVCVKKKSEQKRIDVLLKENLSQIISKIQFPKTMRWEEGKTRFARPIRWISLVYGNKPISAQFAGLTTTAYTYGHRNSKVKKLKITDVRKYEKMLKGADVIINPEERKKVIKKQLDILSKKVKGKVVEDDELLEEATNICEMPNPILCKFKPEFLNLPSAVLITGLKTHTRSFAVESIPQINTDKTFKNTESKESLVVPPISTDTNSEKLLPYFVAISNTPTCDKKEVAYWYEEAVEARLEDAKFYFDEDVKIGLEKRVEEEKKVVWIENLGTLFDKTSRLEKLSFVIAQIIPGVNSNFLLRAAYLSKADLLTNMVREKEYTSLQGVMGGIYAQVSGEDELVSKIISEHYLPKSGDDKLPKTVEGSILSMADKIDNIIGAFVINTIPSGSLDPFGLRRQAIAVHSICLEKKFFLNLEPIIEISYSYFSKSEDATLVKKIKGFFKERLNAILLDRGIKYDVTNAVLAAEGINTLDAYNRAIALTEFRREDQFEPLVIGQKRVNNILKGIQGSFTVQTDLLKEPAEMELYNKTLSIENQLNDYVRVYNYKDALNLLLSLRPEIDSFFDEVLVMTEDLTLRNNRLGLLQYIKSLFRKVADLSEIVIQ